MDEELTSPERVNYHSGQILGAEDFQAEQDYLVARDRRHGRHLHGWGVVCGLGVGAGSGWEVIVEPGLAVDPWGREIVVPEPRHVDVRVITDDEGAPSENEPTKGAVTICLGYEEIATDPGPGTDGPTSPTRTRETCRLLVRDGFPLTLPRTLSKKERDIVLSGTASPAERLALASPATLSCAPPAEDCVVLATVALGEGGPRVDPWTYRRQLYSVAILQELLFRLARRVSKLEQGGPVTA